MSKATYATITIELSKAGIHAYCEEIDEDCFCTNGNLEPLVKLINDAEICNPDTRFSLTEKGRKSLNDLTAEDIQESLDRNNGDRKAAAQQLGMSDRTLYRRMKQYGII